MNRIIKISWAVADGYVGGSTRPQTTVITEGMLPCDGWEEFDEMDKDKQDSVINDIVQDDFRESISFEILSTENRP